MKRKKKRGEGEFLDEDRAYVSRIFAKFSHDAPLPMVKKKHLTVEQLNARRRKVWLTVAKKDIPKVRLWKKKEHNLLHNVEFPVFSCRLIRFIYFIFTVFQAEDLC